MLLGHRRDHRLRGCRGRTRSSRPSPGPATLRAYSMTMHCRPRHRPSVGIRVGAGVGQRADLALDAADAEAARDADRVDVAEVPARALRGLRTRRRRSSGCSPWPRGRSRRRAAPRRPRGRRRAGRCTCRPGAIVTSSSGWCTRRSRSSHSGPVDVAERQVRAGVRRRRRAPRGAAPWGCRRSTARRRR